MVLNVTAGQIWLVLFQDISRTALILPEKNGTIIPPGSMSSRITIAIVLFDDFSISAQPDKQAWPDWPKKAVL